MPPQSVLPQCPGGGEIKTHARQHLRDEGAYHSAPVGARSKQTLDDEEEDCDLTTVPRWGRDQNMAPQVIFGLSDLPQCPGGGEIKTQILRLRGATRLTTVPRWGRDQNPIRA